MEIGEGPSNLDTVLAMFGQIEKKYLGASSQTSTISIELEKRIESCKSDKSLEKRTAIATSPKHSGRNQRKMSPDPLKITPKPNKPQEGTFNHKVQEIFMKYTSAQNESKTWIRRGGAIDSTRVSGIKSNKPAPVSSFGSKIANSKSGNMGLNAPTSNQVGGSRITQATTPDCVITDLKSEIKDSNPSPRLSNKSEPSGKNPPSRIDRKDYRSQKNIGGLTISANPAQANPVEIYQGKSYSPSRKITASKAGSLVLPPDDQIADRQAGPEKSAPDAAKEKVDIRMSSKSILESGVKFIKSFTKGHADINRNSLFGAPLFYRSPGSDKSIQRKNREAQKSRILNSLGSEDDSCSVKEASVGFNHQTEELTSEKKMSSVENYPTQSKGKPPIKVYFKDQSKQVQLRKSDTSSATPKSLMDALFSKVNSKKRSKQNSFDYHGSTSTDAKEFQSVQSEQKPSTTSDVDRKEPAQSDFSQEAATVIGDQLSGAKLFEQHLRNAVAASTSAGQGSAPPTVQIINSNIYFPVIKNESEADKTVGGLVQSKSSSPNKGSSSLFRQVPKSHQASLSIAQPSPPKPKRQLGTNVRSYISTSPERDTLGARLLSRDAETSLTSVSAADRFGKKRKSDQWSDSAASHLKTEKSFDFVRPGSSRSTIDKRLAGLGPKSVSTSAQNSVARLANRPRFHVGPVQNATPDQNGSFSNTVILYKNQNKSYSPSKHSERKFNHIHHRERSSVDHSKPKKPFGINSSDSESRLANLSPSRVANQGSIKVKQEQKGAKTRVSNNTSGTITPLGYDDGTLSEFTMLEELVNRGADGKPDYDSSENSVLMNSSFVSPILANTTKIYKRDDSPSEKSSTSRSSPQILDITISKKDLRDFKILDNVKEHDEFRVEKNQQNQATSMKKKAQPAQIITREDPTPSLANPVKKLFPIAGSPTTPVHHSKHNYYMEELLAAIKNPNDKNSQPFMNHIKHMAQSLLYIRGITKPHEDDLLSKSVYLPPPSKRGSIS